MSVTDQEDGNSAAGVRRWLASLLSRRESLGHRIVAGTFWVYLGQALMQFLFFLRAIILARLLAPSDFGVVAIGMLAIHVLEVLSETGFHRALVQRKEIDRSFLDTSWVVANMRGIALCAILFAAAPSIASFYNVPRGVSVVRTVGVVCLLNALCNPGIVFIARELNFRRSFVFELVSVAIGFVATVGCAIVWRNEWALVAGLIVQNTALLIGSYVVDPFRPRPRFNMARARELYRFGFWVFAMTVVSFLSRQMDRIAVPRLLDVGAMGLYTMAYAVSQQPLQMVSHIRRVLYPAYCRLQGERERLVQYYLMSLRMLMLLSVPLAAALFSLAGPIGALFGTKWAPMVPAIRILALAALARVVVDVASSVFDGIGKPRLNFATAFVRFAVLLAILVPLTKRWHLEGAAASMLIAAACSVPVWLIAARRHLRASWGEVARALAFPLAAGAMTVAAVRAVSANVSPYTMPGFILASAAGGAAYLLGIWLAHRLAAYPVLSDLQRIMERVSAGDHD